LPGGNPRAAAPTRAPPLAQTDVEAFWTQASPTKSRFQTETTFCASYKTRRSLNTTMSPWQCILVPRLHRHFRRARHPRPHHHRNRLRRSRLLCLRRLPPLRRLRLRLRYPLRLPPWFARTEITCFASSGRTRATSTQERKFLFRPVCVKMVCRGRLQTSGLVTTVPLVDSGAAATPPALLQAFRFMTVNVTGYSTHRRRPRLLRHRHPAQHGCPWDRRRSTQN
jgi:hypothetical protein